jgi:prepilin-type N-terminal cleavage/methylation domain-containing protein
MERQKMKKKGFTLVELLVVIAIIAMLLAILMPALGKVRQLAQRIMCGTNLTGIGKAMLTYSTDDKYESFPVSGIASTLWDRGTATDVEGRCSTWDWRDPSAYTQVTAAKFANATISSCLYLVIKYADVAPDQFICPGSDLKKFEISKYDLTGYTGAVGGFADVWDFGSADKAKVKPRGAHNSYCYQFPLAITAGGNKFPISTTSNPAMAVLADRNPFWQYDANPSKPDGSTSGKHTAGNVYSWDLTNKKLAATTIPYGNATYHQKDGQNVLFADLHSKFEKSADCGIEQDNIYTIWGKSSIVPDTEDGLRQCGWNYANSPSISGDDAKPSQSDNAFVPMNDYDNYLVCDLDRSGS